MNEVMQTHFRKSLRHRLLLTASSATLLLIAGGACAQDSDRPTVWIEVGGAFDQMGHEAEGWLPPNLTPPIANPPPEPFGRVPRVGYDFDAAISIEPLNTDWVFTASVRYGRAQFGPKRNHDQTYHIKTAGYNGLKYIPTNYNFADATQQSHASHTILDFSVGKDIGLGMFNGGKSAAHFGVRVARLNERSDANLTAFVSAPVKYSPGEVVHKADAEMARSFNGLGPSVSWDGSVPFAGSPSDGFSFDWGANAAILFGRQKANVALYTRDARYNGNRQPTPTQVLSQSTATPRRNRTVVVPNVGGFAGISWRMPSGKVSLGYRGDFFFGAIDGGVELRKTYNRSFYGPFASVSIGLGG